MDFKIKPAGKYNPGIVQLTTLAEIRIIKLANLANLGVG